VSNFNSWNFWKGWYDRVRHWNLRIRFLCSGRGFVSADLAPAFI
jgi:hypothetical protein